MTRAWLHLGALACLLVMLAHLSLAQNSQYQPAVPTATTVNAYGGYGGWGGGGTVAGSALNGMASAISAAGDYNLSTSAAAINMTQAQRNDIENRQMATQAYFDMRALNRSAREAERGPRPSVEQLSRIAKAGVPQPLSPSELDPVSGRIDWPLALRTDQFASQRDAIEQIAMKQANYGGLGQSDHAQLREVCDAMNDQLKAQVRDMPPSDYTACKKFLRSLSYQVTQASATN